MSFVPVTGPATFEAVEPARDSVVVFTDDHRTVSLPIRAALPVLTRAHQRDDAHPTVGLLAGAVLLAMRMVAAGKIEPDQRAGWQSAELDADDQDRLERLVDARAPDAERATAKTAPAGDQIQRRLRWCAPAHSHVGWIHYRPSGQ